MTDIGISRNAVYQHIERLRRSGALAPRESGLARLRELAESPAERGERKYAEAIEGAIAGADAVALAYELGRLDAGDEAGLSRDLAESALRRLSALPRLDAGDEVSDTPVNRAKER